MNKLSMKLKEKLYVRTYKDEKIKNASKHVDNSFQQKKLKEIIEIIEKHPSTLQKLDIEKLEVIDNYYIEKIAEYKKKIG